MRLLRSLERVWHDVRYGCRVFARSPGFTAIAVLSIACGTGANVAMFSVADALLLRPLPVPDPDDLLVVGMRTDRSVIVTAASYPDYADIRDRSQTFDGLLAYTLRWTPVSTAAGASPQIKVVQLVTANFFDVLQVRPALGRAFAAGEDRVPGRDPVALISHAMWQQQFAADPDVVGRSIRVSGVPFTIVGVTPEGFTGLETRGFAETVYVPLSMAPALGDEAIRAILTTRDLRLLSVRGRLQPGVGITEARAELESIGLDLERAHPATNRDQPLIVQTEIELRFADRIDAGLVALLSILSSVVLAVACANVAGLLASRAPVRAREISLRLALGAGRGRLVRQLITESLALALAGGVCGLAVGRAGILILQQMQYPTDSIQPPSFQLDERALVFSLAIAMASAFLFGIGPALQTTRVDLAGSIRTGDVAVPRRWRLSLRTSLVATQVALSLVLITIAVFTLQIFKRVATTGPGFRTTQMAKVSVDTTHRQYSDRQVTALAEQAVQAAERLPGVTSATVTSRMPFWGMELVSIVPEGDRLSPGQAGVRAISATVGDDYFATMDIPLVRGRPFRSIDTLDAPLVAIVNETLAKRYWPDRDAVGSRFRFAGDPQTWVQIVGVARDSKYFYIVEPTQEALYLSFRQRPSGAFVLLAGTDGESLSAVRPLRDIVRTLDPELPVFDAQTIEMFYAVRATGFLEIATEMVGGIGLMGTLLTMVGLYGLVSYSVARRTREIGIRMAVGATYGHVLRMILRQGMTPAWFGVAAGVILSIAATRLLPSLFPTADRYSPVTFLIVVPALVAVTLAAAFVPARRAARVDPTVALRHD